MSPENPSQRTVIPVTPETVTRLQKEWFPPEVLETFNKFIGESILEGSAIVRQEDVVQDLVAKGLDRNLIFKKGWLNVEGIYREAGWKVAYDKPGYNESYPATFTFSKSRRKSKH